VPSSTERSSLAAPAVLITILAALGVGAPLLRSAPPTVTTNRSAESQKSSHNKLYDHSAINLILEFFDASDNQFQPTKPWSTGAHLCRAGGECDVEGFANGSEVEFLIASVPDPDSVPLRYKFDTYLDAIQQAADTAGFNLYSFDLPWLETSKYQADAFTLGREIDLSLPTGQHGMATDDADNSVLEIKPNDEKRSDSEPGVMLFQERQRHPNRLLKLLLIFVVGETPTTGINKAAFRSALDQIAWLSGLRQADPKHTRPRTGLLSWHGAILPLRSCASLVRRIRCLPSRCALR